MEEAIVTVPNSASSDQNVHHYRDHQVYRERVTEPLDEDFARKLPEDVANVGGEYLDQHHVECRFIRSCYFY